MLDVLGVLLKVGFNDRYPVRADEFLDLRAGLVFAPVEERVLPRLPVVQ